MQTRAITLPYPHLWKQKFYDAYRNCSSWNDGTKIVDLFSVSDMGRFFTKRHVDIHQDWAIFPSEYEIRGLKNGGHGYGVGGEREVRGRAKYAPYSGSSGIGLARPQVGMGRRGDYDTQGTCPARPIPEFPL